MPITTATLLNETFNQSNLDSNSTNNSNNSDNNFISPVLGMVTSWPAINQAIYNNEINPQEIIINNTNQTIILNETNNSLKLQKIMNTISDYEILSYYVDFEERIIINQPENIETEDVYVPLTTFYKNETFQEGNVSLTVNLIEEENEIKLEANFKNELGIITGLNSYCEIRDNSASDWETNFMLLDELYVFNFDKKNSFMYEISCHDQKTDVSLSTIGTWEAKNEVSTPIKEEFDIGDDGLLVEVEDLYIELTDDFFNNTNETIKVRELKTSMDVNYQFDNQDILLEVTYLDSFGKPLVGLNSFCEIRENSTGSWGSSYFLFYDEELGLYQTIIQSQGAFIAQASCYTDKEGEENLTEIIDVIMPTNKPEEIILEKEFSGLTTKQNYSVGTSYGIFNLKVEKGKITDFNVDEELNIAFKIEDLEKGQKLPVELNLPIKIPSNQHLYIWKEINGEHVEVPYEISNTRNQITLFLEDGKIDDDGIANGIIVDPFQLILTDESTEVTTTSSQSALIALESERLDVNINKGELGEVLVVDPRNLPDTPLPPHSFVTTLLKLKISNFEGEGVDVTFQIDEAFTKPIVWKFNSVTYEWYEMPYTKVNQNTIKIHIVDGGLGDDDGIKNGIIIDDVGIVNSQEGFENGTVPTDVYYNTTYNALMLNNSLSGTYYSDIYGSATESLWQNFTWITAGNYGFELPNSKAIEAAIGGIDMSSNVALYHMNEASGNIADTSGNSRTATASGSINYLTPGIYGTSIYFPGDGAHLEVASNALFDLETEMTLEAWFYLNQSPTSFGDDMYMISRYDSTGFSLVADSNAGSDYVGFYLGNGSLTKLLSSTTLSAQTWYHVVATYNGSNMSIYLDGKLDNSLATGDVYTSEAVDVYIGSQNDFGEFPYYGLMDEVAIYSTALSAQETKEHYERGILKLNGSIRSCDDALCAGDTWTTLTGTSPQDLTLTNNPYFQYSFTFNTTDVSYSPLMYNTTVTNLLLIQPNYTQFSGQTTDFSIESNLANVSNVVLEKPLYGNIKWNNNLIVAQANFDDHVVMGDNYVYVNTSNLDPSINTSANITIYNVTWPHPIIYRNGAACTTCQKISSLGTNYTFNVTGFSNYTLGIGTELSISDSTDITSILVNVDNEFIANYTDKLTGLPLFGAGVYCEFKENSSGSWSVPINMTYTSDSYTYTKQFASAGNHTYNISCYNNQSYSNLTLTDSFVIYNSYPDYSGAYYKNRTTSIRNNFSLGTFSDIYANTSTHNLELNNTLTGTFTSSIFNAGSLHVWNAIKIDVQNIYGTALPDNNGNETLWGGVDMNQNGLLYHFDETAGNIIDASGNSNTASVDGSGITYQNTGIYNKAVSLNGAYTFLSITKTPSILLDKTLSIEFWMKPKASPTTIAAPQYIIDKYTTTGIHRGFSILLDTDGSNDKLKFYLGNTTTSILTSNENLSMDTWYHVVATYDNAQMKLYLNGNLDSNYTVANAHYPYDSTMYVGAPSGTGADSYNGTIDELALYDVTLTDEEILNRYKRGVLNLNLEARNCDDASCSGETWTDLGNELNIDLNMSANQYFQYRFNFTSSDASYTPSLVSLDINYTKELAKYTLFSGSTTDFNNHPTPTSVSNAILEIPEYGKIEWNNPINIIDQNFDTNITITQNMAYVNVTNLHTSINTSAKITLRNVSWIYPVIYRNGILCTTCNILDTTGGDISFNVNGFSSYTSAEGTNLTIYDLGESQQIRIDEEMIFYANYSNVTSKAPIIGANVYCELKENSSGSFTSLGNMTYNVTSKLYELNKTFTTNNTYAFNVSCYNQQGYANITTLDTFEILPPHPIELYIQGVTYSNNNPKENEEITVYVNLTNSGTANATNFTVEMNMSSWNTSKNYLGTNQSGLVNVNASSWNVISFTWKATLGKTIFDFFADNQYNITEMNETNNTFTKNISINSWSILQGNMTTTLVLGDASKQTMYNWSASPFGVTMVADVDASYLASDLIALDGASDLDELDVALGMLGFDDAVSKLYDADNNDVADQSISINLFGSTINNIPAYNITGSSFKTGILYDSADGVGYDGSQDIVFVVEVNDSGIGANGQADYELYFPALLRASVAGSDTVAYTVNFD